MFYREVLFGQVVSGDPNDVSVSGRSFVDGDLMFLWIGSSSFGLTNLREIVELTTNRDQYGFMEIIC